MTKGKSETPAVYGPARNVVRVKQLQGASRSLNVIPLEPERGEYLVESASQPGQVYHVTLDQERLGGRCTCPWAEHGGINCKHVLAALREHHAASGELSFWPSSAAARRQHRRTLAGDGLYVTVRPKGK
ncbi:MAG TPA: SWIM zinc finger family protein [Roseiflexaceae bacterium]|nr:SWIM zinc finger family protein [Roseiflexaceae bacterium]